MAGRRSGISEQGVEEGGEKSVEESGEQKAGQRVEEGWKGWRVERRRAE